MTITVFGVTVDNSAISDMREAADAAESGDPGWPELVAALPPACRPAVRRAGYLSLWERTGDPLPVHDPAYVAGRLRATADFIDRRRRGIPFGGADPVTGFAGWKRKAA